MRSFTMSRTELEAKLRELEEKNKLLEDKANKLKVISDNKQDYYDRYMKDHLGSALELVRACS